MIFDKYILTIVISKFTVVTRLNVEITMKTFQDYCKKEKKKLLYFTIFMGFMSLIGMLILFVGIANNASFFSEVEYQFILGFPFTFVVLIFIHRIFSLFINGEFFHPRTLNTIQGLAKVCLIFGLILHPCTLILFDVMASNKVPEDLIFTDGYFAHANFSIAVTGFALHLISGALRIGKDIQDEQEFTV